MEVRGVLAEALNGAKRSMSIILRGWLELSALRWELYATLQNVLDAMAMIVSDLGLKKPPSYADLGRTPHDVNLLDRRYLEVINVIASTRNALAHAYRRMSSEDLSAIVRDILPKVMELVRELFRLVEVKGIDPVKASLRNEKLGSVFAKHGVSLAYLFGSRARGLAEEDTITI